MSELWTSTKLPSRFAVSHEAVEFYQALGLKLIVSARDEYARFEAPSGTSTFSLYLMEQPEVGGATLYFEVPDVDAAYAALVANGIVFDKGPVNQRWLWREARLRDPSGNRPCLYQAGENRKNPPWRLPD